MPHPLAVPLGLSCECRARPDCQQTVSRRRQTGAVSADRADTTYALTSTISRSTDGRNSTLKVATRVRIPLGLPSKSPVQRPVGGLEGLRDLLPWSTSGAHPSGGVRGYIWERPDRGKGVFLLRGDAGPDPITGQRRQLSRTIRVTGPKPKQQDQQKLTELLAEVDAGHHRSSPHSSMTVAEAVENWFGSFQAQVAVGTKGPGTERKYREVVDCYILPHLGQLPLVDLTTEVIDAFYETLLESGRTGHGRRDTNGHTVGTVRAGGPLAPATVRNVHTVVRLVCARPPPPPATGAARSPRLVTPRSILATTRTPPTPWVAGCTPAWENGPA